MIFKCLVLLESRYMAFTVESPKQYLKSYVSTRVSAFPHRGRLMGGCEHSILNKMVQKCFKISSKINLHLDILTFLIYNIICITMLAKGIKKWLTTRRWLMLSHQWKQILPSGIPTSSRRRSWLTIRVLRDV